MKLIFNIILIVGILYVLCKCILLIIRPYFITRLVKEIEELYKKMLEIGKQEINFAVDKIRKFDEGDKALKIVTTEQEVKNNLIVAQESQKHEEAVYEKFLRLKERFIQNPKKIADVIVFYKRYLEIKLNQNKDAKILTNALTTGTMTFEKFESTAKETKLILEEAERKLDILLAE